MDIRFEQVSKNYGVVVAVENLTLRIRAGEFLVLLGPTGCGKTTILRLLAGLETVTSGEIFLGDRPITHLKPRQRDFAMVFQSYVVTAVVIVGLSTLATAVLVFMLSLRLRRREIETMVKIGGSKLSILSVLASEIVVVLVISISLAGVLTMATSLFGSAAIRALILS